MTNYFAGSSFTLTITACMPSNSNQDHTLNFSILRDLQPGTYNLRWKPLHGWPPNSSDGGALLIINNGDTYSTDSTSHTGTFTVTSVNTTAKTFSGGFQFAGITDAGTGTVQVTDGVFTNVQYQ